MKSFVSVSTMNVVLAVLLTTPVLAHAENLEQNCLDAAGAAAISAESESLREAFGGASPYCRTSDAEHVSRLDWNAIRNADDPEEELWNQRQALAESKDPKRNFRIWVLCPQAGKTYYEVAGEVQPAEDKCIITEVKRVKKLY
ncbi:MAG: hypothetical protein V4692_08775 [Bdellovibrionota bacterium]